MAHYNSGDHFNITSNTILLAEWSSSNNYSILVDVASGPSPVMAHFTIPTAIGTDVNPAQPVPNFTELEYSWNFGDATSGTWGPTGKSKNIAKGPITAHIYENPGTYTINVTIKDSTGIIGSASVTLYFLIPL
jgi:hypothetical protein